MILSYIIAVKINLPSESSFNLRTIWTTFKGATIALGMPLIVLGGLFSGFFTATEAAAVAVVYSFIVGVFIYKKIKISDLPTLCLDSAVMTAIPMLVVATVGIFGWILAREQIPALIESSLFSLTTNKYILLLLFNILFLIVGTFLESLTAIILLTPIILPITNQLGIDPVFIGVMMVFNLAIGMSTPPVGVTLYVSCSIAGIELHHTFKYLFLYIGAMVVILFIITYTPGLIMFFPNMFMK
jgi:C4-dicarboxylate transporter DctM subunit